MDALVNAHSRLLPLLLAALATFRCGCGGEPPATKGSIEGVLRPFEGASSAPSPSQVPDDFPFTQARLQELATAALRPPGEHREPRGELQLPGEVLVRVADGVPEHRVAALLAIDGLTHEVRSVVNGRLLALRFSGPDGGGLTLERTRELLATLRQREGIAHAEHDRLLHPTAIPNDKLYATQWHYPLINLPAAWDLSRGRTSVVVAVLDSGIIPHPDLDGRVVQGYDMITDPRIAGDGDGRDPNPLDEGGDLPNGESSWHGAHVAGTIGAATNNGVGVAGVDWNARLLPVRVLGRGGGALSDIVAGIVWAAGGSVSGVPRNANPADVINMSLGGDGPPSASYQEAIDFAVSRNVVVVVAAGNENANTAGTTPCNQRNVICVGATRFEGSRASYSNFGTQVDVMAPGGELSEDRNGDGYPDGVLSTYRNASNQPNAQFLQGTSMAAPHVAGIVALLKDVTNRQITPAAAEQFLRDTAAPAFRCQEGCGAGLVNAQAAVLRAQGATAGAARLVVSTTELYQAGSGRIGFVISNVGSQPIASVSVTPGGAAGSALSVRGGSVGLGALEMRKVEVDVNAAGLAAGATHAATLSVSSAAGSATISVKLKAGANRATGRALVAAVYRDENRQWQVGGGGELAGPSLDYRFEADPREYFVLAAMDDNGNGKYFEDGERFGFWRSMENPETVKVVAGQKVTGVNIDLVAFKDVAADPLVPGAPCTGDPACPTGFCANWPGGYCTRACDTQACPAGSVCTRFTNGLFCTAPCGRPGTQDTCRTGYVCTADGTAGGVCLPPP